MDYFDLPSSERLKYRKLTEEDKNSLIEFLENKSATKFLPINSDKPALERANLWIDKQETRYTNNEYGLLALINIKDQFVGMCGLLKQTINNQIEYEIGYHLLPRFWNQGFASESARHIRDWTFNYTDITSIISIILNENEPSEKVAVKNGMTISGNTTFHDFEVNIWRIDRKDWLNRLV